MTFICAGFKRVRQRLGTIYGNGTLDAQATGINAAGPNGDGSGDSTITLPASPSTNQTITINNTGTGTVTVDGTITGGYSSAEMSADASFTISWNGSSWDVDSESGTIVYVTTVVYATWSISGSNIVLSEGDLVATYSYDTPGTVFSTITKSSGKWYCEVAVTATNMDFITVLGNVTLSNGQLLGVALDMDGGNAYMYINNVLTATVPGLSGSVGVNISEGDLEIGCTGTLTANFGASAFTYSVPVGYNSGLYE